MKDKALWINFLLDRFRGLIGLISNQRNQMVLNCQHQTVDQFASFAVVAGPHRSCVQ